MSENKRKVSQMEKAIDSGHAHVTRWKSVILDDRDGKYYNNELSETKRRHLSDEEMVELRKPGIGLIVVRMVDAPVPPENLIKAME